MTRLPVNPFSLSARLEHQRPLDALMGPPPLQRWRVTISMETFSLTPEDPGARAVNEVGHTDLVLVDLREKRNLLDVVDLFGTLDFLSEVVVDRPSARLADPLEKTLLPGPPGALVVREVEISPWWRYRDSYIGLLSAALTMCAPFARFAICDSNPDTDVRKRRFPDADDRQELGNALRELLETAGFGEYQGFHLASLHDPAYREHNAKIVLRWLEGLETAGE